jgi:hypothetical protein
MMRRKEGGSGESKLLKEVEGTAGGDAKQIENESAKSN